MGAGPAKPGALRAPGARMRARGDDLLLGVQSALSTTITAQLCLPSLIDLNLTSK